MAVLNYGCIAEMLLHGINAPQPRVKNNGLVRAPSPLSDGVSLGTDLADRVFNLGERRLTGSDLPARQ